MNCRNKNILILVTCIFLALTGNAIAAIVDFTINLDGTQAGTGSAATGTGTATINTDTNLLAWNITFDANTLTNGPNSVAAAYFHIGPAGVTGPSITPPGNVAGAGTSPITGSAAITDSNEAKLLAASIYFDIQTTAFAAGEIRGQLIPDKVTIPAKKDNTIYESATGSLSNGAGDYFFAGSSGAGGKKRALISFDISGSGIPSGSTITDAKLTLYMSQTTVGPQPVELHRLLKDWGEGASNAKDKPGQGIQAEPNDATWLHTFYNTSFWTNVGGDFESSASASENVGAAGFYSWTSAQMANDVQSWFDKPSDNFGWLLLGREDITSAKRFDTRTNPTIAHRPALIVKYKAPCPFALAGDLNNDCKVNFLDFVIIAQNWLTDCNKLPLDAACMPKP